MGLCIGNFPDSILPDDVLTALDEQVPMYGVKFTKGTSAGLRTYAAAGMTWQPSTNTTAGVDDFKNVAPFKVRECCRVWDSTNNKATYYYKDDYSDSDWATIRKGTHATIKGDIMIEIPKFWYRRPSKYEFIVAPKYKKGFTLAPAFNRPSGIIDQIRIFKYNMGSGFVSRSGVASYTNINMNTIRAGYRAKGLYMLDHSVYYSLMILMLVKYANMDSQATVGMGYNSGNTVYASGNADNVKGLDGSATSLTANEAVLTLGIENFYGNYWKFIDGMNTYGGYVYITDVEKVSKEPTSTSDLSTYIKLFTTYPTNMSSSVISDISFDSAAPHLMFTTATGTSNGCNDNAWRTGGLNLVVLGGDAWAGSSDGLFAFVCSNAVSFSNVNCSSVAVDLS